MVDARSHKPAGVRKRKGARGVSLGEDAARAMVLTGAGKVFAKLGVRAATVQDVLGESGVSRRTFYRLFQSNEAVMIALYHHGTSDLLQACQRAVDADPDLLKQLVGCIDAHLSNARTHGRLMFVLGGEAQRHESALYARRMQVHEAMVEMLRPAAESLAAPGVDPLLLRAIILALESTTRVALTEGDEGRQVSDEALQRVRRVVERIATASLVGTGPGVTALPLCP